MQCAAHRFVVDRVEGTVLDVCRGMEDATKRRQAVAGGRQHSPDRFGIADVRRDDPNVGAGRAKLLDDLDRPAGGIAPAHEHDMAGSPSREPTGNREADTAQAARN